MTTTDVITPDPDDTALFTVTGPRLSGVLRVSVQVDGTDEGEVVTLVVHLFDDGRDGLILNGIEYVGQHCYEQPWSDYHKGDRTWRRHPTGYVSRRHPLRQGTGWSQKTVRSPTDAAAGRITDITLRVMRMFTVTPTLIAAARVSDAESALRDAKDAEVRALAEVARVSGLAGVVVAARFAASRTLRVLVGELTDTVEADVAGRVAG